MPDQVRFTPDELKELIASNTLTPEDLAKLHPADRKVAVQLGAPDPNLTEGLFAGPTARRVLSDTALGAPHPGVDFSPKQALTIAGAAGVGMFPEAIASQIGKVVPVVKAGAGLGAAHWIMGKMGVPAQLQTGIDMMLGLRAMSGGKGGAGKAAGPAAAGEAAVAAESAEVAALRASLSKKGYPPELVEKILAKDAGRAAVPMAEAAGGASRPPLTATKPFDEVAERVKGGVQNDFRGPVSFQNPTKGVGPRNASFDDIKEQVTGSSRNGWENPYGMGHEPYPGTDGEVEKIRQFIAQLLSGAK